MKRLKITGIGFLLFFAATACTEDTLDTEMDAYCDCVNTAQSDDERYKCQEMMQEISDKYAFDPEASERINKRVKSCIK